jgi:hypothetical protein
MLPLRDWDKGRRFLTRILYTSTKKAERADSDERCSFGFVLSSVDHDPQSHVSIVPTTDARFANDVATTSARRRSRGGGEFLVVDIYVPAHRNFREKYFQGSKKPCH